MKTHLLITYDDAVKRLWKNGLKNDCLSLVDGDTTIKIINIPLRIKKAIEECLEATTD